MHSTKLSASTDGVGCGARRRDGAATTAATRGTVTEKVEPCPGAEAARPAVEHARDAVDDGQPQPSPRSSRGASSSACRRTNSSKITPACRRRCRAVVLDLDAQLLADRGSPAARAPAGPRPAVAQRIGQQVLQDAAQEGGIGRDEGAGRHHHQLDAAARRAPARKAVASESNMGCRANGPLLRLEGAGIELGDVEQRVEQRFHRPQAGVDLAAEGRCPDRGRSSPR
jgi:hypothetical protein